MAINRKLLYPERKRCAACRKYFCWSVIDGLYDSRECAGLEPLSDDPADWPREHYVRDHDRPVRKKVDWLYEDRAKRKARKEGKEAYRCNYCFGWHIGSRNPNEPVAPRRYQEAL